MSTSTNNLIGKGLVYPLNLNEQGTAQLDTGFTLLKSSIQIFLAWLIGERYFLGEFGANPEDLIEMPNDAITKSILQHRIESQLPVWDPRLKIDVLEIDNDNFVTMNVVLNVSLSGTDLSEIITIPITVNNVQ